MNCFSILIGGSKIQFSRINQRKIKKRKFALLTIMSAAISTRSFSRNSFTHESDYTQRGCYVWMYVIIAYKNAKTHHK